MIDLTPSASQARLRRPARARALTAILVTGAVLLWLWALPSLVTRGGFTRSASELCSQASYRDPVSGRTQAAPAPHASAPAPCGATVPGARP
ncbi:hypothetical protein [Bosea sp. (in: a-proteobacteria)]|jgi:hypothetical protein|uniref:hypothetical protein n=1 Tax=Bosea sp. (in: a-proteobacteria) TaxID=1871050 RepID=UPI002733E962|nr:hypothetical protein [Bosea sp. (in: a-proteobacteria)]MDP3408326.1 hypothetical protein [Bosea sp. (in: a-proteobacteria)]